MIALVWYVAAGVLSRSAGDWMTAPLIGGAPWQAGTTLMEEGSPDVFDKMARLYKDCGEQTTELCEAAITVRSIEPAQEGGRTPPTSAQSHFLLRRSNPGQQGR